MDKLQLIHGKQYVNRKGEVVTVKQTEDEEEHYCFVYGNGIFVSSSGQFIGDDTESEYDLVTEYNPSSIEPEKDSAGIGTGADVEWLFAADDNIMYLGEEYAIIGQMSDVRSKELYYWLYEWSTGDKKLITKQDVETNYVKV